MMMMMMMMVVVVDPLVGTDAATFCALSTLQEQIRAEQTVDIYQVWMMMMMMIDDVVVVFLFLRDEETRPDTRHKMRLVCVIFNFENNTGRTYGRTDGHDLL